MTQTVSDKTMKKIISRIQIELKTPLHCGGGEDGVFTDMPVVRDAFGWYTIPGATIAGILRQFLSLSGDNKGVGSLFGWQAGEDGRGSRLTVSDACLIDFDGKIAREVEIAGETLPHFPAPAQVRDHVCIDPDTGTAKATGKFDMELVPPNTRFAFELVLNTENLDKSEAATLEDDFKKLVAAIQCSTVQFGGGQTRGLGYFKTINADTRMFDLLKKDELADYLKLSNGLMFVDGDAGMQIDISSDVPKSINSAVFSGFFGLQLESIGPLLIGGGNSGKADMTFSTLAVPYYKEMIFKDVMVIPASSIKGVIRGRIYKILGYIKIPNPDDVLSGLFGDIKNGGKIGKVRIPDIMLDDKAVAKVVQHVAIDRLTGGTLDGALYSEAPVWVDKLPIDIKVKYDGLTNRELALLIHALIDLAEGDLAIGAGGNRGNGRFQLREGSQIKDIFRGIDFTMLDKAFVYAGGTENG